MVRGFPNSWVSKESACNAGHPGFIPGSGRSNEEGLGYPLQYSWASLVAQLVKRSACNVGDLGLSPWLRRSPWRRERLATPVFWPGEFHGLYYSPRGRRVGHDWVTFTFTNGHGIIPKVTKRVYIRDTNSIQNNKVSLWLTNAWNLLPREATKENRDTEERARLTVFISITYPFFQTNSWRLPCQQFP